MAGSAAATACLFNTVDINGHMVLHAHDRPTNTAGTVGDESYARLCTPAVPDTPTTPHPTPQDSAQTMGGRSPVHFGSQDHALSPPVYWTSSYDCREEWSSTDGGSMSGVDQASLSDSPPHDVWGAPRAGRFNARGSYDGTRPDSPAPPDFDSAYEPDGKWCYDVLVVCVGVLRHRCQGASHTAVCYTQARAHTSNNNDKIHSCSSRMPSIAML